MRVLVIEPKATLAEKVVSLLEKHKLVDMTNKTLSNTDIDKLEENVVVACPKIEDDVNDAFALVFCRRTDEDRASECGTAVVLNMTEKSKEKDVRTIKKAIEEYEQEPSLYEEEETEEDDYSFYSDWESEDEYEDSDKK